ncbi:S-adenosyl-L-methionine-dependent methyltransferase [Aureobasidium pullulans]|nr:S-adenosyl-L-methionine-dependent methyltransferase [Aureobasidium pullulans]
MPRLHSRVLHQAHKSDPLLPLVLRATRDLTSAKNELRWLRDFVAEPQRNTGHIINDWAARRKLRQLCVERAKGKPLQYIMGTEYFGDLEIACKPGVLIPRQETAASVTHLMERLQKSKLLPEHVKLLDLCTGTGCIPLLASYELVQKYSRKGRLEAVGVDISPSALSLAKRNLRRLSQDGTIRIEPPSSSLSFIRADILAEADHNPSDCVSLMTALQLYEETQQSNDPTADRKGGWDILISNPPYISPSAFHRTTTRSVKRYEPKLALVPKDADASQYPGIDPGDIFYPRLLEIAKQVDARVVLFEVADLEQAGRVAAMAQQQNIWTVIEVWRDNPSQADDYGGSEQTSVATGIKVLGRGNGRSVFAYRGGAKA